MAGDEKKITMTPTELRQLMRETVMETLISIGVQTTAPHEMQKDFIYLRSGRESSESVTRKARITLLGIFITGIAATVIVGLKEFFRS